MSNALRADLCLCDKHMFEEMNGGTCVWCGHGIPIKVKEHAYRLNMERNRGAWSYTTVVPLRTAASHSWDQDSCAMAALAWEKQHGRFPKAADWQEAMEVGEHRPSYKTVLDRFGGWKAFKEYCAQIPREAVAA